MYIFIDDKQTLDAIQERRSVMLRENINSNDNNNDNNNDNDINNDNNNDNNKEHFTLLSLHINMYHPDSIIFKDENFRKNIRES